MADQSDVESTLATLVSNVLYPNGTAQASILGTTCRIYRGWPVTSALNTDLANGVVNVTIFPDQRRQQNTTRYRDDDVVTSTVTPTLTITTDADSATIGGTADLGQLAGLLADTIAAVHRTRAGDTPELVAATLATYLRTTRIAQVNGATITIPGAGLIVGRVVADQPAQRETRRQAQSFRITCWCPTPATRDQAASAIDAALSVQHFITLPDGTSGRLRFLSSAVFDQSADAALYRRDLLYEVEYATTIATTLPSLIFGNASLASNGGVAQSLLG